MTNLEVCKFDREGGIRIHLRHNKLDFSRIRLKSKENTEMKITHCLIHKYLHLSFLPVLSLILELKFNPLEPGEVILDGEELLSPDQMAALDGGRRRSCCDCR